jgi:hypothetical protein
MDHLAEQALFLLGTKMPFVCQVLPLSFTGFLAEMERLSLIDVEHPKSSNAEYPARRNRSVADDVTEGTGRRARFRNDVN